MADKKKKSFNELVGMTANYQDLLSNISGPGKEETPSSSSSESSNEVKNEVKEESVAEPVTIASEPSDKKEVKVEDGKKSKKEVAFDDILSKKRRNGDKSTLMLVPESVRSFLDLLKDTSSDTSVGMIDILYNIIEDFKTRNKDIIIEKIRARESEKLGNIL